MIRLQDIDLNLLVIFQHLMQERHVSTVAKNLRLSQPAVSNALIRLRRTLGDPLFVRTSEGMLPTPLASSLAEPITLALCNIADAVNRKEQFDPQTSTRQFTIAVTELGDIDLIPILAHKCHSVAPRVKIVTVRAGVLDVNRELEAGRIDMALGAMEDMSASLYCRQLFKQSYVTVFQAGHAFDCGDVNLEKFFSVPHILVSAAASPYDIVNRCLKRAGIMATVTLEVSRMTAVPYLVRATNYVATIPQRFAEVACVPVGLKYISPPLRLPTLVIKCWWHPRFHQDEGNQWLRHLL